MSQQELKINLIFIFSGFIQGTTNYPSAHPTASTFPQTDGTSRPSSTIFIPSPTSGYSGSTDISDGTTSGDFQTTSIGSTFSSDSNPTHVDDLYNIQNKFPTTHPTANRQPSVTSTTPRPPQKESKRPITIPFRPHYETDSPDVHHSYPLGPDPFPFYSPQAHPPYHYFLDNFDDKHSHFPTGIYAPNTPSLHHIDNRYPQPSPPHTMTPYDMYPSGRYPTGGINLEQSGYNSNRKNGYQVNENSPDVPRPKSEYD